MKTAFNQGMRALCGALGRKKFKTGADPCHAGRGLCGRISAFCFGEEDGNALLEFTLTLPILMAVLVAIFEFGIAFNNQLQLTQAVGSGAQYLQQIRTSTTDPCADTLTNIEGSSPTLNPANITLTLTMNGNSPISGSTCSGKQSQLGQGDPVIVNATYPCNITIFGINIGGIYKWNFKCNLTAQVTEYEY